MNTMLHQEDILDTEVNLADLRQKLEKRIAFLEEKSKEHGLIPTWLKEIEDLKSLLADIEKL